MPQWCDKHEMHSIDEVCPMCQNEQELPGKLLAAANKLIEAQRVKIKNLVIDLQTAEGIIGHKVSNRPDNLGKSVVDISAPECLEVEIREDGKVVWINIDGLCVFRSCQIGELLLKDNR